MKDKRSMPEDEYFARENAEQMRKLAAEEHARLAAAEREALRKAHWMRCPKCGMELKPIRHQGVQIDRCFSCHGTWLAAGELEKLAGSKGGVMKSVLDLFAAPKKRR